MSLVGDSPLSNVIDGYAAGGLLELFVQLLVVRGDVDAYACACRTLEFVIPAILIRRSVTYEGRRSCLS